MSDGFDFAFWRFANDREWMYARYYPQEALVQNLRSMFLRLEACYGWVDQLQRNVVMS